MSTTQPVFNGTSYDLTGPVDAPVVVLIHGLGLCRDVFADILPAFADFRVLSYDLYGHGASAPPPNTASLTVYADQLAGLMGHLGIASAHIVGFSIGGMINRRFALDHPQLVKSLTILNSPHDRGTDAQAVVEARAKSVRDQGAFSTFDAALARWFTPAYLATGTGPALVRQWREVVPFPPVAIKHELALSCERGLALLPIGSIKRVFRRLFLSSIDSWRVFESKQAPLGVS